ncbi:MAG: CDP-alcohol phosphatidyltransferase family protein [Sedimentisphaerales bacterium]|nr:CDP-alcohol phosphatidyltransferase family protein [Sedimentisphaerales bacterium]
MLKQIPNILTIGRFVLTVIVLVMILYSPTIPKENYSLFLDVAFVLFVIAGLTDMVDGTIARRLGVASKFGRMLDPLADKVLVCGAVICFALLGKPTLFELSKTNLAIIHWSYAAILILREVYVTILRHIAEAKGINFAATTSGKIKMFLQSFAIGTVMVKMAHVHEAQWGWWFTSAVYILTVLVTVVSGIRATQRPSWKQTQQV